MKGPSHCGPPIVREFTLMILYLLDTNTGISIFPPADLPGIGSFQDGGLMNNFAARIACRLSRQIWPSRRRPARVLSMGTGKTESTQNQSPHFRHVFRDSFVRRGFDAWMSSMDSQTKWLEMRNQLEDTFKPDYFRFDVPLRNVSSEIDNIEAMEDYKNLVVLQPGAARMAREAASSLLVSRFYFVLGSWPENTIKPFWCRGTIRCKGRARELVAALQRLHPGGISYTTNSGPVGRFAGVEEICPTCERYCRPMSFFTRHTDEVVSIYIKAGTKQRWRISGFPSSIASLAEAQHIVSPFGRPDHGKPAAAPCSNCDGLGNIFQGTRRKRSSASSRGEQAKRARVVESPELVQN